MTETEQAQRNRDLLSALYQASFSPPFSDATLQDLMANAPPALPRQRVQRGPEAFLTNVLP
jgi:hypothetical protein